MNNKDVNNMEETNTSSSSINKDSHNNQIEEKDRDSYKVEKKGSSKFLVGIIILLLITIVGILGWFLFFSGKPNSLLQNNNQQENTNSIAFSNESQIRNNEIIKQANLGDNSKTYSGKFNLAQGFADVVDYALPAVVNVSAVRTVEALPLNLPESFVNPFLKEFFKQFNLPTKKEKAISLGSGFIVRSDGFIVTNFHVIKGAKNIKITLHDGKVFDAKIYASDPMTDLAVLKVSASNLSTLEFGDSSKARVGDWVIAIGNPFGLGGTVSAGIVSARGRDINIGMYDEFIQTDAAINRGNSGGPMIDTKGRIIGVNTAIFSTTGGGSIGIGFAVPSDVVKNIVAQLITDKKVTRGWVGVQIQDIDQAMAKVLKLPNIQGALISGVTSGGPADKAGLKVGDIIVFANDIKVENKKILPKLVSMHKPGDKISLKVISNGIEKTLVLTIDKFPEELEKELINEKDGENRSRLDSFSLEEETFEDMGFKASNITDEVKRIFGLGKEVTGGVLITAIENGSLAEEKGLVPGLIIASVNNRKINNIKTLKEVLKDKNQNNFMFLVVEPARNLQFFISLTRGKTEETEE